MPRCVSWSLALSRNLNTATYQKTTKKCHLSLPAGLRTSGCLSFIASNLLQDTHEGYLVKDTPPKKKKKTTNRGSHICWERKRPPFYLYSHILRKKANAKVHLKQQCICIFKYPLKPPNVGWLLPNDCK